MSHVVSAFGGRSTQARALGRCPAQVLAGLRPRRLLAAETGIDFTRTPET